MNRAYLTSIDVPALVAQLHRATVGFDRMFDNLNRTVSSNAHSYPPHDIIQHSDTTYTIEVACAGFKEEELDVTVEDNILTISGAKLQHGDREYLYNGISSKAFTKVIPLATHVKVNGATYQHGLLIVELEIEIPEALKPRRISIKTDPTPSTMQIESKK